MECFLCGRNVEEIAIFKLPVDFAYKGLRLEIIGNYKPDEYICWGCVGYQYDFAKRENNGRTA
jgi:hypothetical protein